MTVIRKAKANLAVSRRRQLSMLWKLELKNLLIKNNMPLYAQKEKGYIADKIADYVPDKTLEELLTDEVINRGSDLPEQICVLDLRIDLPKVQDEKKPYIFLVSRDFLTDRRVSYIIEMGDSPKENARRIIKFLKIFGKEAEKTQKNIDTLLKRKSELAAELKKEDNTYTQRIKQCEAEVVEIRGLIKDNTGIAEAENEGKTQKIRRVYKK